jgi:hypothetical protein
MPSRLGSHAHKHSQNPPLFSHLLTTPALRAGSSASGVGRRVASPRGFEPLLQP